MRKILASIMTVLLMFSAVACADQTNTNSNISDNVSSETPITKTDINMAVLKGPTAFGTLALMDANESGNAKNNYNFTISAAPDEVNGKIIKGEVDIAAVPANVASVLFNKTNGEVQMLAVNTLGTLYVVSKNIDINSVADLKGQTIYLYGQGSTPEFALNYILKQNGLNPESDVTIQFLSEHAEAVAKLASSESGIAVLPEPFVTNAMNKDANIKSVLDLTAEWNKVGNGSELVMGCIVARKSFIEENPQAVKDFLVEYEESIRKTETDVAGTAQLSEKYDIIPAKVAEKAIPNCNIVYIDAEEMKTAVNGFFSVLFEMNPNSIGGKIPGDELYFIQ